MQHRAIGKQPVEAVTDRAAKLFEGHARALRLSGADGARGVMHGALQHLRGEKHHRGLQYGADYGKEGERQHAEFHGRDGALIAPQSRELSVQLLPDRTQHRPSDPCLSLQARLGGDPNPMVRMGGRGPNSAQIW
ncbi:hypothetical protein D3C72_1979330 [compost metagenome]